MTKIEILKAARALCARGPCVGAFQRDATGEPYGNPELRLTLPRRQSARARGRVIDGHCYCPLGALLAVAGSINASDLLAAEAQRLGYRNAVHLNDERPELVLPMFDAAIARAEEWFALRDGRP